MIRTDVTSTHQTAEQEVPLKTRYLTKSVSFYENEQFSLVFVSFKLFPQTLQGFGIKTASNSNPTEPVTQIRKRVNQASTRAPH